MCMDGENCEGRAARVRGGEERGRRERAEEEEEEGVDGWAGEEGAVGLRGAAEVIVCQVASPSPLRGRTATTLHDGWGGGGRRRRWPLPR